ncbi:MULTISPECIES: hypothetical protein [unclassified Endozoicomonas]|uniref:hypothetical protein n=1 Tax=unclassified Endozoicomonas TaxID=2644528 RepID=UPI003BB5B561
MNIPAYPANFNVASDRFNYFQTTIYSQSATSCQAFSREVVDVDNIQCIIHTDETTKSHLQTMVLFDNPFSNLRLNNRSIGIANNYMKDDHPIHLPVGIKTQNDNLITTINLYPSIMIGFTHGLKSERLTTNQRNVFLPAVLLNSPRNVSITIELTRRPRNGKLI